MTFLNPLMLFGGLAAAIPIAMHFFYRAHYKPLPWAAMKFLRLSIEQTSRRLRFQEILLLILRVLVCLILALALARPASNSITSSSGRGESVDAVIIVDTSYSMDAKVSDSATRLDRAKEAALKVIDNLPPSSTVQIISCASKAVNLGPQSLSNLDQARYIIRNLKTSSMATDYLDGFSLAVETFNKTEGGSKEVYLIGDMQRSGWEKQTTAVRSKCEEIRNQASLYLVRVGEEKIRNIAVVGIQPQTEVPHVDADVAFTVLLRNSGSAAVENLNVTLGVDGQEKFQRDAVAVSRVEPGETKPVAITGKFKTAGWQLLTARINEKESEDDGGKKVQKQAANEDDLEQDDVYRLMLRVHEKIRVIVVDGSYNSDDPSKAGSFFLANALLPIPAYLRDEYYLSAAVLRPEQLTKESLNEQDICFLVNVGIEQFSDDLIKAIESSVRGGMGLFISTGANVDPVQYNRKLGSLLPVRLTEDAVFKSPADNLAAPDLDSIDAYSFLSQLSEKGNNPLMSLMVGFTERITPVADPRDAAEKATGGRALMRFNNGMPMLLSRSLGTGEVMLLTTTVDNSWSILCETRAFVPFINGCVSHMNQRTGAVYNHTAGDVVRWTPRDDSREYYLYPPEGDRVFLGKPSAADGTLPTFDSTQAGIYRIEPDGEAPKDLTDRVIFNPDLTESANLDNLTDEQIDSQLDFKPVHLSTGWDGSTFTGTERSRNEWTIWLLVALLFFAIGETLFAWFCGRTW